MSDEIRDVAKAPDDRLLTMPEAARITGHDSVDACRRFLRDLDVPLVQARAGAHCRVWLSDLHAKLRGKLFHGEQTTEGD